MHIANGKSRERATAGREAFELDRREGGVHPAAQVAMGAALAGGARGVRAVRLRLGRPWQSLHRPLAARLRWLFLRQFQCLRNPKKSNIRI